MSVIAMRTVSIRPASTSALRASRSRRPFGLVSMASFLAPGQLGLGLLDGGELLLWGLGHQVVSAVEEEIDYEERVDAEHYEGRVAVHDKRRHHGREGQDERDAGGGGTPWRAVWALEVG